MNNLSEAQIDYLHEIDRKKKVIRILRILILVFFLLQWEFTTRLGIVDSFVFSSPSSVITCFINMLLKEDLLFHIGVTLAETLISFFLVSAVTLGITTALWLSETASKITEPYLVVLNSLPKSALAPLLIVWLGANYRTIILTGMSVAVFGSILSLYTAFKKTDPDLEKLVITLSGTRADVLKKIVIPSNLPVFINLMKVNVGLCLVGVIIGEFISSRHGLGYLIIYGSQVFKLDWVIMSIILLCILATLLYALIGFVEKKCPFTV